MISFDKVPLNSSSVLTAIDHLVHQVYNDQIDNEDLKYALVDLVSAFKVFYRNDLSYVPSIQGFMNVIAALDKMLMSQSYDQILNFDHEDMSYIRIIIRESLNSMQEYISRHQNQEKRNQKRIQQYLTDLTVHYSKLLFVRVDLGYLKEQQYQVDVGVLQQHMDTFRQRLANQDGCFSDLQGYAWALEEGATKGLHAHILLIYDGHKHQQGFGLAKLVGDAWLEITGRTGMYFNCHDTDYIKKFEREGTLGIGMIHRNKPQQIANAINAAKYLVNPEKGFQYLRSKTRGMRTFGVARFEKANRRINKIDLID
ncbi:inovirus-type Gp2 protein [Acinetobacter beijerinckii]|uniref:YagK/YfjJ domain-containing protein n=1 Tax=Acinetobacter beijerinckii TaxID=262668 RepID=UPI0023DD920C|nr:inovirus-type Gp2 protein [Acinetobacter beijerinckii]MDF2416190.1 inovirus-type Gp2 protein [Acinetobacter beijerinckii]